MRVWTLNPAEMDTAHYKNILWNTISETLEIAGYPVEKLAKEFGMNFKKKLEK